MPNSYFQFKEFRIDQALSGMKVTTDACLFGAWIAHEIVWKKTGIRLLDIGTGTGLLSLMVAQKNPELEITAIEVNDDAYAEAVQNIRQSKWDDQVECKHTRVQEFEAPAFDMIICNPPFFKDNQKGMDAKKNDAVHASLLPPEELLLAIQRLLSPDGLCYLLYPEFEMNGFLELAVPEGLFPSKVVEVRNQQGQSVFRSMVVHYQDRKANAK